jgi:hypothetical protein
VNVGVAGERNGTIMDAGDMVDPEAGDENIDFAGDGSGVRSLMPSSPCSFVKGRSSALTARDGGLGRGFERLDEARSSVKVGK